MAIQSKANEQTMSHAAELQKIQSLCPSDLEKMELIRTLMYIMEMQFIFLGDVVARSKSVPKNVVDLLGLSICNARAFLLGDAKCLVHFPETSQMNEYQETAWSDHLRKTLDMIYEQLEEEARI